MIFRRFFAVAAVLCMMMGCRNGGSTGDITAIDGYDLEVDSTLFASLVTDFECFQLESQPESILSMIVKAEMTDSLILVSDSEKVLAFKRDGKFSHRIGEKGKAENEYLSVGTFTLSPRNEVVVVDVLSGKIVYYTISGEFIETRNVDPKCLIWTYNGCFLDEDNLFISRYVYNDFNALYGTVDLEKGEFREIASTPMHTDNVGMRIGNHPFSHCSGHIRRLMPFSPVIYGLNQDEEIYEIKTDKGVWTTQDLEGKDFSFSLLVEALNNDRFPGFTDIFESEQYIWLLTSNLTCTLVDKKAKTCRRMPMCTGSWVVSLPLFSILCVRDNTVLSNISSMTMMSGLKLPETEDSKLSKLKKLIDEADENGNPILLLYTVK